MISLFVLLTVESLCLYYLTTGDHYLGLSSSLYGLYVVGAFLSLSVKDYWLALPVFLLVFVKMLWDVFKADVGMSESLIGAAVATEAHLFSVGIAICIGLFYLAGTHNNSDGGCLMK